MRDLAYSLRILARHPRYTVLAILTLAAGIGVTAAMFGLLDALYFRIGSLYEAPEMYVYVPYAQHPQSFGLLFVETATDTAGIVASVRQRLAALDANIPVLAVSSFADHMERPVWRASRVDPATALRDD